MCVSYSCLCEHLALTYVSTAPSPLVSCTVWLLLLSLVRLFVFILTVETWAPVCHTDIVTLLLEHGLCVPACDRPSCVTSHAH